MFKKIKRQNLNEVIPVFNTFGAYAELLDVFRKMYFFFALSRSFSSIFAVLLPRREMHTYHEDMLFAVSIHIS
jgi:hypothetical protein